MIGERRFPTALGGLSLPEGAYGKDLRGRWWCRPPGESNRRPLDYEHIVEHRDSTITVRGVINGGLRAFALEHGSWTILKEDHA